MRAVEYDRFRGPLRLVERPPPVVPDHGALVAVAAAGLCRSDWHGWAGHDDTIALPIVPGHEWAGTVLAVGSAVTGWRGGERVTAPFVCGCGRCAICRGGDPQVCPDQTQPGFTHDGAFAEQVLIHHADTNLVALPDSLEPAAAAAMGCRFATAYRAVAQQGRVAPGDRVAVHGCGGVGLSAVMVAAALGARVVAVDVSDEALALAATLGAETTVRTDADDTAYDVGARVRDATAGGARVSLDAFGSLTTSAASVHSLARRGRHVQVGLLPEALGRPPLPMDLVVAHELEILGTHGLAAASYPAMLDLVERSGIRPELLVTRRVTLADVPRLLPAMSSPSGPGVTVVQT